MSVRIEQREGFVRIPVHAQPRASRSEVVGEHDGALKVRLAAPPVDGEANRELVRLHREKDEFIGMAAHDLRSPLSHISNIVDLMTSRIARLPELARA
jgi:uncharacterized protein YggU (UPF0235/DUF167 family)